MASLYLNLTFHRRGVWSGVSNMGARYAVVKSANGWLVTNGKREIVLPSLADASRILTRV